MRDSAKQLAILQKLPIKKTMGTVAHTLAEYWHRDEMQHRAFHEFTDTTACFFVTTKFIGEAARAFGDGLDDTTRSTLDGYDSKLRQIFHPAVATSIWKSIAFVLLSVLTFGVYYAVSTTLLWRSFDRKEDVHHRTLSSALANVAADGGFTDALLLSRILLLAEKLFEFPASAPAAQNEWTAKDPRMALYRCHANPNSEVAATAVPDNADGAMEKFCSLFRFSPDVKPTYTFRAEVQSNFAAHAQEFETLCALIKQRFALEKLMEASTKKEPKEDEFEDKFARNMCFTEKIFTYDELTVRSDKYLLKDIRSPKVNAQIEIIKAMLAKQFDCPDDQPDDPKSKKSLSELLVKKADSSKIVIDDFCENLFTAVLKMRVTFYALFAHQDDDDKLPPLPLRCDIPLGATVGDIPDYLFIESCKAVDGCEAVKVPPEIVAALQSSMKGLIKEIDAGCARHSGELTKFIANKKKEFKQDTQPEQDTPTKLAEAKNFLEDEIRKTFLPIALGLAPADRDGDRQAK